MTNMVAIQTVTVGSGGAANITFSNIPQTYTDLVVKWSARVTDTATDSVQVVLQFNGDTGSNYTRRSLYGDGGAAGSSSATTTFMRFGWASTNGNTANTFGQGEFYVPNYTGSSQKSVSADGVAESNATQYIYAGLHAGLWTGTSAISSITLSVPSWSFMQYSTATLYGVTSAAVGAKATGGIISQDANYYYHTFKSSGTFTPSQSLTADILVVAGGGGGGSYSGGGGGGGGLLTYSSQSLTNTNYTVTIGAGGNAGASSAGTQGSNSVFGSLTASIGGGYGFGNNGSKGNGGNGGSGGGAGGVSGSGTGGSPTSGQGYAGGNSTYNYAGAGGGGAGAAATNATSGSTNGGAGLSNSLINSLAAATNTGVLSSGNYYFAGGGAGNGEGGAKTGGVGGGGNTGTAGTANTGGGGGGDQGNGGSGIVIVRYAR